MNTDRIRQLADYLRKPEVAPHFALDSYFSGVDFDKPVREALHDCGAVACIAGHAIALFAPETTRNGINYIPRTAGALLGLTSDEADALFEPHRIVPNFSRVTTEQAARVLDHLADTGKIDWRKRVKPRGQRGSAGSDGALAPHAAGEG